jgi:phosphate transport system substrate-binding protein
MIGARRRFGGRICSASNRRGLRMKKVIGLSIAALVAGAMAASTAAAPAISTLSGAGSFLVAPLVAEWAQEFRIFFGITVNYATVGSQTGINDISSGAVDFAAPDSPLTSAQTRSCRGCHALPRPALHSSHSP